MNTEITTVWVFYLNEKDKSMYCFVEDIDCPFDSDGNIDLDPALADGENIALNLKSKGHLPVSIQLMDYYEESYDKAELNEIIDFIGKKVTRDDVDTMICYAPAVYH